MNVVGQYYSLLSDLVSIIGSVCLCISLASAFRKIQSHHLTWLVPLAAGHVFATPKRRPGEDVREQYTVTVLVQPESLMPERPGSVDASPGQAFTNAMNISGGW